MLRRLVIASRQSRLALWQAEHIQGQLRRLYPALEVEILALSTRGDEVLDRSLAKIGGKGLFIKELEEALRDRRADVAVHSLKDVPAELAPEFTLAAVGEREDPRDAFVCNGWTDLAQLPQGAAVGTSSLRREAQLRAARPDLRVLPLRGNVETRLAKLDRGEVDAALLAVAGLTRLGLAQRVRLALPIERSVPAIGQGALAIECLAGRVEVIELLRPLHHLPTAACVSAERALGKRLSASCETPLGAHAWMDGDELRLTAFVASRDGSRLIAANGRDAPAQAEVLGARLGGELLARGAAELLVEVAA